MKYISVSASLGFLGHSVAQQRDAYYEGDIFFFSTLSAGPWSKVFFKQYSLIVGNGLIAFFSLFVYLQTSTKVRDEESEWVGLKMLVIHLL